MTTKSTESEKIRFKEDDFNQGISLESQIRLIYYKMSIYFLELIKGNFEREKEIKYLKN